MQLGVIECVLLTGGPGLAMGREGGMGGQLCEVGIAVMQLVARECVVAKVGQGRGGGQALAGIMCVFV